MKPSEIQMKRARFFDAIAHRRRQMLSDILLAKGHSGYSFEQLRQKSGLSASTLSFHLRKMDQGGFLIRRQQGKYTWISIEINHLRTEVLAYLNDCSKLMTAVGPAENKPRIMSVR